MKFVSRILPVFLLGGVITSPAQADQPTVRIATGTVVGATEGETTAFKGIPYAQAPVGPLRWRAPQPATKWAGVRDARNFGAICMQPSTPTLANQPAMAEDCLTINVWRPIARSTKPLPVLVWIHGGGWVSGSSAEPEYGGSVLASRGIIVVSFNYRLGRFGFFAHPALAKENADRGLLGNYGYMDQVAALRWVRDNIRAFGGDPKQVTIFGSSAGGASVEALMIAPGARGLFSAAIASSSPTTEMPGLEKPSPTGAPSGEAAGQAFAKLVGAEGTATGLRAIPATRVLESAAFPNLRPDLFSGPMVDSALVVEEPLAAFRAGRVARVPFIGGAQGEELMGVMLAPTAELLANALAARLPAGSVDRLWPLYDPDRSRKRAPVLLDMVGDRLFVAHNRETVIAMGKLGVPAWEYRFAYVPEAKRATWLGAGHGSNGAFAFDRLDELPADVGPFSPADQEVATRYSSYIVNFVKRHDPNGGQLPDWPMQRIQDHILWLGNDGVAARVDPWADRLGVIGGTSN